MFSRNTWIIIVVVIVAVLIMFPWSELEEYCGCSGIGNMSAKPTYFVYRPFGDVSSYSDDTQLRNMSQFATVGGKVPLLPMQDLGWKTGMPYDAFVSSLNMNSWAAGSDPDWKNHSSVPFLKMGDVSGQFSDPQRVDPGGMTNYGKNCSGNGGYARNYGSKCENDLNANNMVKLSKPDFDWPAFVSGPYGYPNMLSNGLPEIQGPAGEFINQPCAEANAYNLGVGVL
jgi:hypothetical protein